MIDKLEMFIAVAREKHFGKAAQLLGITQPSLSSGIKYLEEQLGVQLILRGSRYGGLTPEGQRALIWARKIVGDTRQFKEEMRFSKHGLTGTIRMAVIPTAVTWASSLANNFIKNHPNVHFSIYSRSSQDVLEMLDNLEIDVGISYLDNEPLGKVITRPLYIEDYVLVCSPSSHFAELESIEWGDLKGQKLCLLTPDMQNRRIIDRHLAQSAVEITAQIESSSTVILVSNILQGNWLTVLPYDLAQFLTEGKGLKSIPIIGNKQGYKVGLIASFRDPLSPALQALLNQN